MKYLNLGCGSRFHEDWINFDFVSNSTFVQTANLIDGIPLENESIDVVYNSHVLEHFTKSQGEYFLNECFRVLKKGGVLRVVVPDLEQIAINYLETLKNVSENKNELTQANYNWAKVELLDQLVREKSGGEMFEIWKQKDLINENQIVERLGDEFLRIRKNIVGSDIQEIPKPKKSLNKSYKSIFKNYILRKLKINDKNLELGNFRNQGEVHKWMYDSYSLKDLLFYLGFKEVKIVNAFESGITNWENYTTLDIENGKVRKPDSLFIEAYK
jgi:predicted SAM-dependent methyltransferase